MTENDWIQLYKTNHRYLTQRTCDHYIVPAAFDLMHCDQIRFTGTNLLYTKESRHPQDIFPDL